MKRLNKILICVIIVFFIVAIFITIILLNLNNEKNDEKSKLAKQEQSYINSVNNPASVVNGNKPELIQYETVYLTVKNSLKKYLEYCSKDNSKAITAIIDKQYIEDNKTDNNTINIPDTDIEQLDTLYIEDIYALNGVEYHQFYIKYYIDNNEKYTELNQDTKNNTFSIVPLNKSEYEKILKTVINGRTGKEKEIEKNKYNVYTPVAIKEEGIAEAYLEDLKEKILSNPNRVYDILDKDFKENNFSNYSQFSEYISKHKEEIKNITFNRYSIKRNGINRTYTCVDSNDKTFIFNITAAMKYTVVLNDFNS